MNRRTFIGKSSLGFAAITLVNQRLFGAGISADPQKRAEQFSSVFLQTEFWS
jgi:hypothetical protein